jgi:hypothetical protein
MTTAGGTLLAKTPPARTCRAGFGSPSRIRAGTWGARSISRTACHPTYGSSKSARGVLRSLWIFTRRFRRRRNSHRLKTQIPAASGSALTGGLGERRSKVATAGLRGSDVWERKREIVRTRLLSLMPKLWSFFDEPLSNVQRSSSCSTTRDFFRRHLDSAARRQTVAGLPGLNRGVPDRGTGSQRLVRGAGRSPSMPCSRTRCPPATPPAVDRTAGCPPPGGEPCGHAGSPTGERYTIASWFA